MLRYSGTLPGHHGVTSVTFAIYDSESSDAASWQETQNIVVDDNGHFDALLGATTPTGIPSFVFIGDSEKWLSIRTDNIEASPRVRLVSVPYAIRAADADTLGGLPASAFLLAQPVTAAGTIQSSSTTGPRSGPSSSPTNTTAQLISGAALTNGSASYVAKFFNATDLINSQIFDNGTNVGIGTNAPLAKFHVESVSTTGQSAFVSEVTVANTTPVNGVTTSMNMNLVDSSKAVNLSNQAMRVAFIRDASATGGVTYFDAILTATAFLYGDTPFVLRGLNVEIPRVAAGKTLSRYDAIHIEGTGPGNDITENYALIADAGSGKVGIGTASPTAQVDIRSSLPAGSPALNVNAIVANANPFNGIAAGTSATLVDQSVAPALSKQVLRSAYIRDGAAIGSVTGVDVVLDAASVINSDAPYTLRALNVEGPVVAAGKTLGTFFGAYVAGPTGLGRVSNAIAFASEPTAGNVGIGTTTPRERLEVAGNVKISGGAIIFPDGSRQSTAVSGVSGVPISLTQTATGTSDPLSGNVTTAITGIATTASGLAAGVVGRAQTPAGMGIVGVNSAPTGSAAGVAGVSTISSDGIGVYGEASASDAAGITTGVLGWISSAGTGSAAVAGESSSITGETTGVLGSVFSPAGYGVEGDSSATTGVTVGVAGFASSDQGRGVLGVAESMSGANFGVRGVAFGDQGTGVSAEATDPTGGTVGLRAQVASPNGTAAMLTNTSNSGSLVIGRVTADGPNVFRIDTAGKGYFNGGAVTGGADFAETFSVRKDSAHYEPGDVLAIDPEGRRRLVLAQGRYSTTVAGVYSTKPGVLAAPQDVATSLPDGVPLAVVGVVPCKVTAENGSIRAGDLLVVSSVPGHAMKATDSKRMTGAIVGKALQSWTAGKGVIEILVTLQ
jgi:hypothetical protein